MQRISFFDNKNTPPRSNQQVRGGCRISLHALQLLEAAEDFLRHHQSNFTSKPLRLCKYPYWSESISAFLFRLERVLVGFDHLLRRDTRTTSTPCIELFKPFFGAFARKNLDFKLRCIIIG